MDAFAAGDMTAVAACFGEDAQLLQANRDTLRGRAAIEALLGGIRDMGAHRLELESAEVEGVGDAAWEVGQYVITFADGTVADRGKYMAIWKRSDSWRFHRFMSNTNLMFPV
jgi:ketosteroid isomerase-like protein